jgi:hypothetical protein
MIARHGMRAFGLALLLAACAAPSPPTRFHALAPLPPPAEAAAGPAANSRPLVVSVGPVTLPEYLNRPQIVTRESATQMQLADFDQWVEPFDSLFPRVLTEDLAARLDTDRISLFPPPRDVRVDFGVEVDVVRFDAESSDGVVLDAFWRVYGRERDRLLDQGRARIERPLPAPPPETAERPAAGDYPTIVAAMSEATADLAGIIAEAVRAKPAGRR